MKQATPVVSRRKAIASTIFGIVSAPAILKALPKNKKYKSGLPLPIGINAGTIRRFNIPLNEQLELASKYGYDAIEIWTPHINAYLESGGKLPEIRAMLADNSIDLCNVIGFAKCMVDDSALRNKSLEEMKRDMSNAASLGAKHIAVTMLGVEKFETEKIPIYAQRYFDLIELGKAFGIEPLLELWGHRALRNLHDASAIAIAAKSKSANLLLDFYHLYRGGNSFDSLSLLNLSRMPVFHINDYPALPERENLSDADRVFPGDGICPFSKILPQMYAQGFRGTLSLEVFENKAWENYSPEDMLKIGYEKSSAVMRSALKDIT